MRHRIGHWGMVFPLAACLCLPLAAQQPKGKAASSAALVVSGDTVTLVKSLPFRVTAPEGGTLYDWLLPDGVRGTEDAHVLTVTACPKGAFVVRCRVTTIDFKEQKVSRSVSEVEVSYGGDVPPGPKPPPVPPPDDPLVKALGDAYRSETHADRAKHLESLAALYRQAAKMDLSPVKTAGELYSKLKAASLTLLPADALPAVRRVVGSQLSAVLPSQADAELTAELRQRVQALFGRLGDALTEAGR